MTMRYSDYYQAAFKVTNAIASLTAAGAAAILVSTPYVVDAGYKASVYSYNAGVKGYDAVTDYFKTEHIPSPDFEELSDDELVEALKYGKYIDENGMLTAEPEPEPEPEAAAAEAAAEAAPKAAAEAAPKAAAEVSNLFKLFKQAKVNKKKLPKLKFEEGADARRMAVIAANIQSLLKGN